MQMAPHLMMQAKAPLQKSQHENHQRKRQKNQRPARQRMPALTAANGSADADSQTANRAPISSAPQDVIDVGSAAPDARKRGWWSRGE